MERRKDRLRSPELSQDLAREDIEAELADQPQFLRLFKDLPDQLWARHFSRLQEIARQARAENATEIADQQLKYLSGVVDARKRNMEEVRVGDASFAESLSRMTASESFGERVQHLLDSTDGYLGSGQTARVKSMRLVRGEPIAVKYLLTPTEKTLSADAEYDMLREVETVSKIEVEENRRGVRNVHVPHPYFFYKNDKLQCYGMQQIQGLTIQELLTAGENDTVERHDLRSAVWRSVSARYGDAETQKALSEEMAVFIDAMHEVCLHGDIKLGNMMIDTAGDVYVIDFGQSVAMNLETEKTRDQFDNLKVLERDQANTCIQAVFLRLQRGGEKAGDAIAA